MAEKVLTKEIAEEALEAYVEPSLDEFTAIDDTAAEILSKFDDHLELNGLTSLSDAAAESLSKKEGPDDEPVLTLVLDNLPPSAAKILLQHPSFWDDDVDDEYYG